MFEILTFADNEFFAAGPVTSFVILSFMKFCVARTFLVESHLVVLLEVELTKTNITKLVDRYHKKIH